MSAFQKIPGWVAAALLCVAPLAATAQEEAESATLFGGTLSGNVSFATDYMFRGYTQTNQHPAIQGGVDWAHDSGLYFGGWGSNLDWAGGVELDLYGGYTWEIGGVSYDFGAVYFVYPDENDCDTNDITGQTAAVTLDDGSVETVEDVTVKRPGGQCEWDYLEIVLNGSYQAGLMGLSFGVLFSPDYWGESGVGGGDTWHISAGAELPLELNGPHDLTLSANVGFTRSDSEGFFAVGEDSYLNWDIGASVSLAANLALDFRYYGSNLDEADVLAAGWTPQQADGLDGRFAVSLSYEF